MAASLQYPLLFSLLPFLLFILFLVKWLSSSANTSTSNKNPPPSPPKLPIIGNLHQLGLLPHRSLQTLAGKYGSLMLLRLGSVPVLVVSSAAAAREILKTHDLIFSSRPQTSITNRLLYGSRDVAFAPYGEYWRQVRSTCVLHLLSAKRVQSFRKVREDEIALMVEKIRHSSSSSSSSSLVNLSEIFVSLTYNIICRTAFGKKYSEGEGGRKFRELVRELGDVVGGFNVGDYIPRLAWLNRINGLDDRVDKLGKELDRILEGIIEEHLMMSRNCGGGGDDNGNYQQDLVDVLIEVQRDETSGFRVHRDTIKAVILDIFGAGFDTTYTVLEWTMTELLRHPRAIKKLRNEVRETAKGKQEITEDDLEKMHYLKAVLKESLRLHPPIPLLLPRESTQEVKVMGYDIAAGTRVLVNAWAISRDPFSWDDPEEFRPERFFDTRIDFRGHDFELIPFGAGRRGCPGMQYATVIDELALANVLLKFELSLPDGGGNCEGQDLDMAETAGISCHKKNPLLAVATPYCL